MAFIENSKINVTLDDLHPELPILLYTASQNIGSAKKSLKEPWSKSTRLAPRLYH